MANWLQKFSRMSVTKLKVQNLPVIRQGGALQQKPPVPGRSSQPLPPATLIYGVAASALLVMALTFFIAGHWLTGFLIILPAAALLGFAMHFLKR